jgi:hypothetical protein
MTDQHPSTQDHRPSTTVDVLRRVIVGVLLLGMGGLFAELLLLAHYEDLLQRIPLAVLALGLMAMVLDVAVPRTWTSRLVQLAMAMFVVAGLLGMFFHFRGSREFQLEMDPALGGFDLVWHVLRAKSPPTLSPGTMVQMGILGLGYAYLRRTP